MRSICLLILVMCPLGIPQAQARQITVVFRYDDYSELSNTEVELRLIDAFRARGLCCTFGVIPARSFGAGPDGQERNTAPLSDEKAGILKAALACGAVDVALHGYSHQEISPRSEFIGLDYDQQRERLRRGKDLLSATLGLPITTFIPPHNTYDESTLRALHELGFRCLSADTIGVYDSPASAFLKFLPCSCGLAGLPRGLASARRAHDSDAVIVVLFHPTDFIEADAVRGIMSLGDLEQLLDWTVSQKDVVVTSIGELLESGMDLSLKRFVDNKSLSKLPGYVPPFVSKRREEAFAYFSSAGIHGMKPTVPVIYVHTALLYFSVALSAIVAVLVLKPMASTLIGHKLVMVSECMGVAFLLAALGFGLRDANFGYKCALLIAVLLGVCVGRQIHALRARRAKTPT